MEEVVWRHPETIPNELGLEIRVLLKNDAVVLARVAREERYGTHYLRFCDSGSELSIGTVKGAFPPEPPKPAGWVIEDTAAVKYRWRGNGVRSGGGNWRPLVAEVVPFATESEAREAAKRLAHITVRVLPVDAAGNVIEAAGEEREWEAMRADLDAALTERADLRIALRAVEAERDKLTTDEADLRHALRQIAGMVGVAVALGASTEMHCAVADEVRLVVERLRHAADGMRKLADDMSTRCDAAETDVARLTKERDALAAEVQRSREQKPVRWATVRADGTVAESCWFTEEQAMRDARDYGPTYRAAPLYLAPVVRDHSGVIAQCEEALRLCSIRGKDDAILAALAALRGAS